MRFNARHLYRYVLVGGALVALGCAPSGAWAQQNGSQDQDQTQVQGQAQFQFQGQIHSVDWAALDQFLDAHPDIAAALRANPELINDQNFLGQHNDFKDFCDAHPGVRQDLGRNRGQFENWFRNRPALAKMDQFLEAHPNVDLQLRQNPSLITNEAFLNDDPGLRDFLNSNPGVKQAFDQNPARFMSLEDRIQMGFRDHGAVAIMDQFLDSHQNVERQIAANPSLLNDQNFLNDNRELRDYLNSHPQVWDAIQKNPAQFMQMEARFEGSPADRAADNGDRFNGNPNPGRNPNPDLTRGEVASMDQFLDQNPKIENQLEANPSLINNPKYLNDNPQLRAYLSAHPQVREEFTENPSYFMQREDQFDRAGNGSTNVATMDAYLDKHPDVARDLNAYPARINDSDYLAHHKDLDNFLRKHPELREQFSHNPSAFMHQESSFDACAQMDYFLDNHKNVRKDLDQNPQSVKDDDYLDHHKDLKAFLAKNPGVGDQFQSNPRGFMDNERKFEANRQMDFYLTKHKDVAKDLQKNPDRVKDAKYLDHHKDLKQLMDQHPRLEEAANTNPSAFMQEQMKFHEDYKNQQVEQKTKVEERAKTHGPQ